MPRATAIELSLRRQPDNLFGPAPLALGWAPGPRYILRRSLILSALRSLPPGRILEVGPAIAALLFELADYGHSGVGVEKSAAARSKASQLLASRPQFSICESLPPISEQFDYLLAFEVLEHIEHDSLELGRWLARLRTGGTIFLSVPTRKSLWNDSDITAGHYRRYEKEELLSLIAAHGLEVEQVIEYGWPLTFVTHRLRGFLSRLSRMIKVDASRAAYCERSGIARRMEIFLFYLISNPFGRAFYRLLIELNSRADQSQRGDGIILIAKKTGRT